MHRTIARPTHSSLSGALLLLALTTLCQPGRAEEAPAQVSKGFLPSVGSRVIRESSRRPRDLPSDAELAAAGTKIGEIRIRPLDIFDTSIPEEDTGLFRLANKLHIRTRESTIADQLLFESGQPYDGRLLQESARLLRGTRYLHDARIEPVALRDGVVDVEVVTNDVWTLNPGISFCRKGGKNTSGFEIEELNLLGLGTQIGVSRSRSGPCLA